MAEKVAKLGITREKDFMYYVKDGGVWKVQRKQPGVPKGKPEKVADGEFKQDPANYIYFVDKEGDVSRAKRAVGGQKRKKAAAVKKVAKKKKPAAKKPAKKVAKKKPAAKKPAKKKAAKKKSRR